MVTPARAVDRVDAISDTILSYMAGEFSAAEPPRQLLVSRGSDAWMWARALAFLINALESQAAQNALDILPDKASDDAVARFGALYALPREQGVAARNSAFVTGTPSASVTIPAGSLLVWSDGTLYAPEQSTVLLDGAGEGLVTIKATTVGASTTRDAGDVLTWQSAPSGLDPTATVTGSPLALGADAETVGSWAQRIIARLQRRPPAGARENWRAWALSFQGIDVQDAWVYPLLRPGPDVPGERCTEVLGCMTVVCAGPPQGDSPINSRVLGGVSGGTLGAVAQYINGEVNALGLAVSGEQLRPVAMADGNWTVETITESTPYNVAFDLVTARDASFSFTSAPPAVDPSSTAAELVIAGDVTSMSGLAVLVNVGPTNYRGGFCRVLLPAGVYDAGPNVTTFDLTATSLPSAPVAPFYAYPAPGCWQSLRAAVFSYFDGLGPGVITSNVDPTPILRYPTEDSGARSTLYVSALEGVALAVPGIVSATVTSPAGDVSPNRKVVVTLGTLLAVPA
jgi:hypothetical protein